MSNLLQKLMLGGSAAALLAGTPFSAVFAQDTQGNGDIEQVVVSASRITIAGYSQPTPVTVVGAAQLEQDAYANISDSVANLPQVSDPPASISASQATASVGTTGANFVNLRNLGTNRTLVLFDSQRVAASTILSGGVDVTTFPSTLVERIDVVTGGASAAWGSDAVAGVINFVLNKNFTGIKATVQGSDTSDGLDRDALIEGAWGGDISGGRGHFEVAASVNFRPDTVLLTQEKWFNGSYWVSNPAYVAGNSQPQLIVANNVGLANSTLGGLIVSSPKGTIAAANALRGIQFVGGGIPQLVNFGNVTLGVLSNGGSLTDSNGQQPQSTLTTPNNTYTFFGYGRYKLTDTIQASAQLNASYFTGKATASEVLQTALTINNDNAYMPASVAAAMQAGGITSFTLGVLNSNNYNNNTATGATFYSQAEGSLGPGVQFIRRDLTRGVFTLDGTIGDDWSWTGYIQESEVRNYAHFLALDIVSNLTAAEDAVTVTSANVGKSSLPLGSVACRTTLTGTAVKVGSVTAAAGCIPLDVFGTGVATPAAIGYITGTSNGTADFDHQILEQDVMEGSMQGTLPWELPAGKVAVAFGMGYRKEAGRITSTSIGGLAGYSSGNYVNFPSASYSVIEGFGEVDAPILKNNIVNSLNFSMAGRMTSYSTSGLVETWKLGATSQVNDDIKLRTTWSVDIRAPQLNDLFAPGVLGTQVERDPKSQANVTAITNTAGNPNLVPEIARTISGGAVLTPTFIPGLSLSADWYSINLTGEITSISLPTILNQCNATLPSTIYPGTNGNPNDPLCNALVFNGPAGALSNVNVQELNIASQTVSGLDLQANYTLDFWDGTLAWSTLDSYTDENTICNPGSGCNDFAGASNVSGSATGNVGGPKWKGILAATYTTGPYAFTAQTRWYGTAVNQQGGNTGNQASAATANLYDPAHYEVSAAAFLDLRGNYKWNDNISFFGAIDNTLNTPPPLVPPTTAQTSPGTAIYGTSQSIYPTLGRTFRLGIRLNY